MHFHQQMEPVLIFIFLLYLMYIFYIFIVFFKMYATRPFAEKLKLSPFASGSAHYLSPSE